ncbi:glyoxalase [Yoonia sp. BS5-3]|uniref:Glyoxalase n=1 Tax=Yoonia phaeophyticola TaxID=3137369 RepID=A0ABZ2VAQ6_9RHOB
MIVGLDHIQIALPAGSETIMRAFYCDLLRLDACPKPTALQGRGGFWAQGPGIDVHFGVDPDFQPARKAHPAFIVKDIHALHSLLTARGHTPKWDTSLPDVTRFFVNDPVQNRIEILKEDPS